MKSKFWVLLLIILFFLSCMKKENLGAHYLPLKVKSIDSLFINIPDSINRLSIYWEHDVIDKQELLLHGSLPFRTLYKYNLSSQQWMGSTKFDKEGPNAINMGTGFFYKNKDSIFIVNGYEYTISLFNSAKEKQKTYNLPDDFTVNLFLYRKGSFYQDNLYFPGSEYIVVDNNYTSKAHMLVKLNLLDESVTKLIKYPNEYLGKIWKSEVLGMPYVINKKGIIGGFAKSPFVRLYDLEGNLKSKYYAKSTFIGDIPALGNKDGNSIKAFNILYSNGYYTYMLYDDYRKVYYRLAYHLPEIKKIKKKKSLSDMLVTIIVLNDSLKYLGEVSLSEKVSGFKCFVNENGLHLTKKPKYVDSNLGEVDVYYSYIFDID